MPIPEIKLLLDSESLESKLRVWKRFSSAHNVFDEAVPLFEVDDEGRVVSTTYGVDKRRILKRSRQMEYKMISEVMRVMEPGTTTDFEGIVYMMLWKEEPDLVIPLYIGKSSKYGRNGTISTNLKGIQTNFNKFARWGSSYYYHIGDLSAVACPGHPPIRAKPKYHKWASRLFTEIPSERPMLVRPTYFWTTAWSPKSQNIWMDYGKSSLSFQEYLLIGVASDLFPQYLLNEDGVNSIQREDT